MRYYLVLLAALSCSPTLQAAYLGGELVRVSIYTPDSENSQISRSKIAKLKTELGEHVSESLFAAESENKYVLNIRTEEAEYTCHRGPKLFQVGNGNGPEEFTGSLIQTINFELVQVRPERSVFAQSSVVAVDVREFGTVVSTCEVDEQLDAVLIKAADVFILQLAGEFDAAKKEELTQASKAMLEPRGAGLTGALFKGLYYATGGAYIAVENTVEILGDAASAVGSVVAAVDWQAVAKNIEKSSQTSASYRSAANNNMYSVAPNNPQYTNPSQQLQYSYESSMLMSSRATELSQYYQKQHPQTQVGAPGMARPIMPAIQPENTDTSSAKIKQCLSGNGFVWLSDEQRCIHRNTLAARQCSAAGGSSSGMNCYINGSNYTASNVSGQVSSKVKLFPSSIYRSAERDDDDQEVSESASENQGKGCVGSFESGRSAAVDRQYCDYVLRDGVDVVDYTYSDYENTNNSWWAASASRESAEKSLRNFLYEKVSNFCDRMGYSQFFHDTTLKGNDFSMVVRACKDGTQMGSKVWLCEGRASFYCGKYR